MEKLHPLPIGYIVEDPERHTVETCRKIKEGFALACGFTYIRKRLDERSAELHCDYHVMDILAIDRQVRMTQHWKDSGHCEYSGPPVFSQKTWNRSIVKGLSQ